MNVPLLDLKAQYRTLKRGLDDALIRVAESQYFILGPDVKALESNISSYVGTPHAIGVSSGTDALLLALMAMGVGPGDGVLVPTFSFFATAGVVARLHATPVFVDIDPCSYNISPAALRDAINKYRDTLRLKAIIPVHLFGQAADMAPIMEIAGEFGLFVVEDAAQAIGTTYGDGRRVGSIGHAGCFSFFPSKNLGGFGDGGVITANDDALSHRMEIMRVHGGERKYFHEVIGGNFRLDAIQAAVLNVKLPHLDSWTQGRQRNAAYYNRALIAAGVATRTGVLEFDDQNIVLLPGNMYSTSETEGHYHIYNQYCLRVRNRDGLVDHLRAANIGCEVYYPLPFHRQACFADVPSSRDRFPVADTVSETIFAIPIYPELTDEMKDYVVDRIVECVRP
jgi:dTDP-4-amino-4,6-dideoxygalactose transaminase